MEFLTIILSVVAIVTAIYYYYLKNLNVFKRHGIPHVPPKPIVGNLGPVVTMQTSILKVMEKFYNLHPDAKYVGLYEFTRATVLLRDLDLIKSISVKNFDSFQDHRGFLDKKADPLFAGVLFFLDSEEWKGQRNLVSPVFTSSKIKTMYKLMSACAVRFADFLSKLPESERELELKVVLSKFTNDVIASCAFGIEVDTIKNPNNELFVKGKQAVNMGGFITLMKQMVNRNMPFLANVLNFSFLPKNLAKFFEDLINDTMKTRQEKGIYRPDMLQLLMEQRNRKEGKGLTNLNIVSHAFGFYFGGFDSVATQTSFIFQMLAENPDVQTKLQSEIDEVLENNNGQLTYEAMSEMTYLDAVVNETMRLHAISFFLDRICTKTFELPPAVPGAKPFTVQPGSNIWIPVSAIHRDPKYYENPDKFDPERFVNDGKSIINSGAFIPFGIGPRMCIGNRFALTKMKVIVCHILARCDVKLSPKSQVPLEMNVNSFALQPKNGFILRLEPRKNTPTVNVDWINGACKVNN